MAETPTNVVKISTKVSEDGQERIVKLQRVLARLTPRGGPSAQVCKTADYDGQVASLVNAICEHTEEGVRFMPVLIEILAVDASGDFGRFMAKELKERAKAQQRTSTED